MDRARVVFVPGMMGSALVDPSVPAGECGRILRSGRLAQRILALLRLVSPALPLHQIFAQLACRLDPRELWGANGMALWMLDPDGWERRLSAGDGFGNAGGLRATGLFRIRLPRFTVDPYDRILGLLNERPAAGARGVDLMIFPYDWRLDIAGNATALADAVRRRWWGRGMPARAAEDDRILIVAHSMGGLIARYYIEHLGGHRAVRHLITAGTPHRGAPVAYAILTGQASPLGRLAEPGRPADLISGFALPVPSPVPQLAGLDGQVLPGDAQLRLFRHCCSGLQLLPSVPFVRDGGGALEPLARTYADFRHPPTNQPAVGLLGRVHDHLVPAALLPDWLARRGVRYMLIASDGTPTVTEARRSGPGRPQLVVSEHGDGVVPLRSAQLRPEVVYTSRPLRTPTFPRIPHQRLFQHDRVLSACREVLREHTAPVPAVPAVPAVQSPAVRTTGVPSIAGLLALARTVPKAKNKAVVSAVHLDLRRADARELLGVEITVRMVGGRPVRCLARKIPGTGQCPVERLDYPGVGPRDFVYVDPFEYQVRDNVGGILLLPEPFEDFVELLTWNVGQVGDLHRRDTNRHHAETQFTNWFAKQDRLSYRSVVSHLQIANTTYSPCAYCCSDLGKFTGNGPAAGVREARIGWTELFRSKRYPHLDTTARSLAQLGPVWVIEPGSRRPAVFVGPPAPQRRRVPAAP